MTSASINRSAGSPSPTGSRGNAARVLVVEGANPIRDLLSRSLRREGWDVRAAATGSEALRIANVHVPDAVVLEMNLPDMDGLEVLRRLRARAPRLLVVLLSARDSATDCVVGLTAGGDDYITRPFSLAELVVRLRGLLRRAGRPVADDSVLVVGDLALDETSRKVTRGGQSIRLSAKEFDLLRYLMCNPRRVLSKGQILDRVWDQTITGKYNVVELYVSYLRRKIDSGREPMIHTVRGVGYVLKPTTA